MICSLYPVKQTTEYLSEKGCSYVIQEASFFIIINLNSLKFLTPIPCKRQSENHE